MSKTFRVNPETFEEAQERNYLKRKKKRDTKKEDLSWVGPYETFPDKCETGFDERNDSEAL